MKAFLTKELERCKTAMTDTRPGEEEYQRALESLRSIWYTLRYDCEPIQDPDGANPDTLPEPEASDTPTGAEEPEQPPEEPKPAPSTPKLKKEDVRAALADARLKGVNVSKLIADLGASNLSGVDPSDYPRLMETLAKELEGAA